MPQPFLPRLALPAFVVAQIVFTANPLSAQTNGSWKDDVSGNWSSATAWVSGAIPGGSGSIVNLTNDITATRVITINSTSRTVGILNVGDQNGSDAFTVAASGGASLIFDNGGSASELNLSGGSNTISAPISLLSSLTIANAASGAQTLSGNVSGGSAGTKTIVNSGSGDGGVTVSGVISNGTGTVAVTQNSATSSLTLLGNNTYTGNTTLSSGRLQVGSNTALGSGTLVINGGSLSSNNINTRSVANAVVLGGDVTLGDIVNTGQLTMGGSTTLTGNRTLTVAAGSHAFWSGAIAEQGGSYGITKNGEGILTLSGSNDLGAGITLNAGTLRVGGNRTLGLGTLTLNGGTLSASSATARAISNAVTIGGDVALGDATNNGALTFSGVTTLTGNRTLTVRSAVTISGTLRDNGSNYGLTKSGSATLTISGTSTYTGGTTISSGTLALGKAEVLANSGAVSVQGGTFDLGGFSETVGAVNIAAGSIDNGILTGSSYAATSGTVGATLAGSGVTLTKSGAGTLILSGTNTYSGATTVNSGTLHIASTGRINATSGITVQGGGRFVYDSNAALTSTLSLNGSGTSSRAILSGTGTIHSAIVLNDVGDTLAPGNSPGTLNFAVSQSWDAFSYDWEVNNFVGTGAGTDFDQISIAGGLDLNSSGSYILNITSLTSGNESGVVGAFEDRDQSWIVLTTTTGITDFDASKWFLNIGSFSAGPGYTGSFSINKSLDGNNLVLTYNVVPEPSTLVILGTALGFAVAFRRRFRR